MNKLVSVIVPVYGTQAYLNKCIESITNQTYQNLEIILVDDGSPDDCPKICDEWARLDTRIKVIHKTNGGLSSARNAGLDIASGDFLSFVDSDDWIAEDLFEKVMNVFGLHNPDIVTFDCNRVNENGEIYKTTENIQEKILSSKEAIVELLKGNINNYVINKVYNKDVFNGVRFPELRAWEDMATTYKLFMNSSSIYCYPVPLYFYLTRSNSISQKINEKALGDIFLAQYERYMSLNKMPSVQGYSLPLVVLAARRLYDRSLWKKLDKNILEMATGFLEQNKEIILNTVNDKKIWLYYKFPKVYDVARIFKHKIGAIFRGEI